MPNQTTHQRQARVLADKLGISYQKALRRVLEAEETEMTLRSPRHQDATPQQVTASFQSPCLFTPGTRAVVHLRYYQDVAFDRQHGEIPPDVRLREMPLFDIPTSWVDRYDRMLQDGLVTATADALRSLEIERTDPYFILFTPDDGSTLVEPEVVRGISDSHLVRRMSEPPPPLPLQPAHVSQDFQPTFFYSCGDGVNNELILRVLDRDSQDNPTLRIRHTKDIPMPATTEDYDPEMDQILADQLLPALGKWVHGCGRNVVAQISSARPYVIKSDTQLEWVDALV